MRSAARRSRNQRRATAILAMLGHGQDGRGTRRRRKRNFLVKKTRIYGIAMQDRSEDLLYKVRGF